MMVTNHKQAGVGMFEVDEYFAFLLKGWMAVFGGEGGGWAMAVALYGSPGFGFGNKTKHSESSSHAPKLAST